MTLGSTRVMWASLSFHQWCCAVLCCANYAVHFRLLFFLARCVQGENYRILVSCCFCYLLGLPLLALTKVKEDIIHYMLVCLLCIFQVAPLCVCQVSTVIWLCSCCATYVAQCCAVQCRAVLCCAALCAHPNAACRGVGLLPP